VQISVIINIIDSHLKYMVFISNWPAADVLHMYCNDWAWADCQLLLSY